MHNFMRGLRTSRLRWPSAVVARGGLVPDRRDVCHRMGSSRGLSTTGSARQCCSWGALLTIHSTAALLTTSFSRNHCTRQAQTCRHERDRVPGCWAAFRRFSTDGTPPVAKCSGVPPLYHPPSDRGCPSVRRGGALRHVKQVIVVPIPFVVRPGRPDTWIGEEKQVNTTWSDTEPRTL